MGLGSALGGIAGGIIGGPAGAAIGSSLFGGSSGGSGGGSGGGGAVFQFSPFSAGGVTTGVEQFTDPFGQQVPRLTIETSPERQALVSALSGSFANQGQTITDVFRPQFGGIFDTQLGELANIRSQIQPGIGALTEARQARIEDARQRSLGNLRDNLARRRVLGSSFAQDAQQRAEAEFGRQAADADAQSFLEELALTRDVINQQFQTGLQSARTDLDLFIQSETAARAGTEAELQEQDKLTAIATQLSSGIQTILGNQASLNANLAAQAAQGSGQLAGITSGLSSGGFGGILGNIFGGPTQQTSAGGVALPTAKPSGQLNPGFAGGFFDSAGNFFSSIFG